MNRTHRTFRFFATGLGLGILLTVFAFSITHHAALPTPHSAKAVEGTLTISGTSQSVTGDLTAARLLDQANTAYLIDPAASGTSLATAGTATIAGTLTLGNAAVFRPAFGPLSFQYKSGLDAYTTGLTIQDTTGNVGIGTTSPGNILSVVQSSATDPIADAWTTYSSRRWKTNITPLSQSLPTLQKLEPVRFQWKANGKADVGLIAEDVGRFLPEAVAYEENGVDAKSIDYDRIVPLLIGSIQELATDNEQLKARIATLEERLK